MGDNPHGLVFYGFALVDEDGISSPAKGPWQRYEREPLGHRWEPFYLQQKGLPEPADKTNRYAPEWEEWRAKGRVLINGSGVDVVPAGYEQNRIDCIVIKESYVRAEWSEIKPLKTLEPKAEWDEQLREWCQIMGIEYREPGWYVAALYF